MFPAEAQKYRVSYIVTRVEYYEVEATSDEEARESGFLSGVNIKTGETVDVVAVEAELVVLDSAPVTRSKEHSGAARDASQCTSSSDP